MGAFLAFLRLAEYLCKQIQARLFVA